MNICPAQRITFRQFDSISEMSVSARRDLARPITSLSPSHVEGLGPPGLSWIDRAIEWALAAAQSRSGVGVNGKETQGMAGRAFECSVLIYQKSAFELLFDPCFKHRHEGGH